MLSFAMVAVLPCRWVRGGAAGQASGGVLGCCLGGGALLGGRFGGRGASSAAASAGSALPRRWPRRRWAPRPPPRPRPRLRPAYRRRRAGPTGPARPSAAAPRGRVRSAPGAQRTGRRRWSATPAGRRPSWRAGPRATRGRRACVISSGESDLPSSTPPLITRSGWALAKSRRPLAASTGSPLTKAIADGPCEQAVEGGDARRPWRRSWSGCSSRRRRYVFAPRDRRSSLSCATVSPRYSVSTAAVELRNSSVSSATAAALSGLAIRGGLLPCRAASAPDDPRETRTPRRRCARGVKGARGRANRSALLHLRGSPAVAGPSATPSRGRRPAVSGTGESTSSRAGQANHGAPPVRQISGADAASSWPRATAPPSSRPRPGRPRPDRRRRPAWRPAPRS